MQCAHVTYHSSVLETYSQSCCFTELKTSGKLPCGIEWRTKYVTHVVMGLVPVKNTSRLIKDAIRDMYQAICDKPDQLEVNNC
ncbi:hypothetical protein NPIL_194801 [Nephila pilipes]|uniref:Uncharacterized protein n=1 Tax=Nephila pilipes TaxID=299642 RepID=A0A8X6N5U9_NEPPI|nr:hypothetical protein NPIL_15881 [Nephila pilipes]GFT22344.1 hypothetical protein NPIL_194801 [Nephila pilipes]